MRLKRDQEPSRWHGNTTKVAVISLFLLSTFVGMLQVSIMMKLSLLGLAASDYSIIDETPLPQRKLRSAKEATLFTARSIEEEYSVEGGTDIKEKQIAYAISVTSCQSNSTNVLDGAAILGHSIHLVSQNSSFGYARYAFVYEQEAAECVPALESLGWTTIVEHKLPVEKDEIVDQELRGHVDMNGCCGIKEFMKLKVYTLEDHPIAIHLDTDALLLQPLDLLYNTMLLAPTGNTSSNTTTTTLSDDHFMFHKRPTKESDFYFTRDYHQGSTRSDDPSQYGVQGGFLAVRPNRTMYQELITRLAKKETYGRFRGWSGLGHTGFWGSSQIQGYLSYVYKHHYPGRAVELNRCIYNAMINDSPYHKRTGACLTKEKKCQDCRTMHFEKIMSVHLTTCRKPWECPHLTEKQHPKLCRDAHRAWFQVRQDLEKNVWKRSVPLDGWRYEWTLGYCQRPAGMARLLGLHNFTIMGPGKPKNSRQYVPLILPSIEEQQGVTSVRPT